MDNAERATAPESDDDLLVPEEVAGLLRVGRSTVYRLIRDGDLPHVNMPHAPVRVTRGQVKKFIASRSVEPIAI
jgi:excisionase family DNA binding protein